MTFQKMPMSILLFTSIVLSRIFVGNFVWKADVSFGKHIPPHASPDLVPYFPILLSSATALSIFLTSSPISFATLPISLKYEILVAKKLLETNKRPWITIPDCQKKIDDLRADENTDKKFLNDYDLFVQDLEAQHRKNL